jgi:hypothetical protein
MLVLLQFLLVLVLGKMLEGLLALTFLLLTKKFTSLVADFL